MTALRSTFTIIRSDRGAQAALALFVAINFALLACYFWSDGGQSTHLRVEARGDQFTVIVDGRSQSQQQIADAAPTGGIVLTLFDTQQLPSLPSPRGIDSISVTDLDSGAQLFGDDFSAPPAAPWEVSPGAFFVKDGMLRARGPGSLALRDPAWRNYAVDVTYRNVQSAAVVVRSTGGQQGVVTTLRPLWWNDDDSKTLSVGLGDPTRHAGNGINVRLSRDETLKSLTAMLLHPYPYIALLLVVALLLVAALQFVPQANMQAVEASMPSFPLAWAAAAVAVVMFLVSLYFNFADRSHIPYVPDAVAYIFQARLLAGGHVHAPPPPVFGAFDFFSPSPIVLTPGRWASQYPFGHPLMLAIGVRIGAIWVIPPILASASVAMLFVVGRRMFNQRVGLLAAIFLATSPFFIMNANDFMSHNTAAFYLLGCLVFLTMRERRPLLYGALAGLAFGLLLNTRPLSAIALVPAFGALLLAPLVAADSRRRGAIEIAGFVAGGLVMVGAYMLYNYGTTGDALRTGYQATGVSFFTPSAFPAAPNTGGVSQSLGVGGQHNSLLGLQSERVQAALLLLVLDGWPTYIGLGFVLLPFILATRRLWDWFLLASALSVMGIWVLYEGAGVMYGPRYWYEAMPFLLLLAARGADRAADLLAAGAGLLRTIVAGETKPTASSTTPLSHQASAAPRAPAAMNNDTAALAVASSPADRHRTATDRIGPPLWASRLVVFSFVAALVGSSVWGWLLSNRATWKADFVPSTAQAMCCVLGIDDRIPELVEAQHLNNALVLVEPCSTFICYGSVFWRNAPTLDGDIVYVKDIAALRDQIVAAFPGRAVYVAKYTRPSLQPYQPAAPRLPPLSATSIAAATNSAAAATTAAATSTAIAAP